MPDSSIHMRNYVLFCRGPDASLAQEEVGHHAPCCGRCRFAARSWQKKSWIAARRLRK